VAKMELTSRQKQAVESRGGNLLVSAAAGSGKTSVLARRIVSLIEKGADIRRMLIVTYTNLAAAEMRDRIRRELSARAEELGQFRLEAQAEYVQVADICTIHSFAARLIRENFLALGLPQRMRVGGQEECDVLAEKALEQVFTEFYEEEDAQFLSLRDRYSGRTDDRLREVLLQVYSFCTSRPERLGWLEAVSQRFDEQGLAAVLQDFSLAARRMEEESRAEDLLRQADRMIQAAQEAWDGQWYRRGYYEDGTPLGSRESSQCQIDSIAQSFALFPAGTDRKRADEAVSAALGRLFDREAGVVRLFDPAFDSQGEKDPGYIKGYPAGVRENGGQYTHASVWLAIACFRLDRPGDGWAILKALLPEHHPTRIYRAEPYVIAADVSYAPGRVGWAGWSWYTGAAGWYWQAAVQELLGLKVNEGRLTVEPNLPPEWPGYEARWKLPNGTLSICVKRSGSYSAALDGQTVKEGVLLAELSGAHRLEVTI